MSAQVPSLPRRRRAVGEVAYQKKNALARVAYKTSARWGKVNHCAVAHRQRACPEVLGPPPSGAPAYMMGRGILCPLPLKVERTSRDDGARVVSLMGWLRVLPRPGGGARSGRLSPDCQL